MDDLEPVWIRSERVPDDEGPLNPYVDMIAGDKPPEIIEFEMNMNPYSNMPPTRSSLYVGAPSRSTEPRHRNPLLTAISMVLLVPVVFLFMRELALHFSR
ncbi:MAG: hypothetical protein NVS2B16_00260 [Chloroflexota bacterium]